ncbi:MAG: hypothetical protein ACPHO4_02550, partial [Longimicrobiales bacterium]
FRSKAVKPFADLAEIFTLSERLGILRRAWQRWGLRGVSTVLSRESEVHKLLTNERILGLDLIRGRKIGEVPDVTVTTHGDAHASRQAEASEVEKSHDEPETAGLPLFGDVRLRGEE